MQRLSSEAERLKQSAFRFGRLSKMASIEEKTARYRQFFRETVFFYDSPEGQRLAGHIERLGGVRGFYDINRFELTHPSLSDFCSVLLQQGQVFGNLLVTK